MSLDEVRGGLADWDRAERPGHDSAPAQPPTLRPDHAALEAARARRDVAEHEAQRHAGAEWRTDLAAECNIEPPAP